ncbi:MAG: alpha/beta hydrolase [Bacteroidetes bacterium HGW-Bacteroidetes-20]|nr:MAG: alpha/beta hydrolase [Bacteroidetes bacterium HGW-Bacteroidetes-20]
MKKKILLGTLIVLCVLGVVYALGPKVDPPKYSLQLPLITNNLDSLEQFIELREKSLPIKKDNESRIIWANDTIKEQTEWVLLYIHGFSASYYEGADVNIEFAKHFKCNAYFPRIATHGIITEDPLLFMTPDTLWESGKEALVVAHKLGKKVMIMSTSTGGTLSLKLAAEYPELVDGLILYSPNIKINAPTTLLTKPWGLQMARLLFKGKYRTITEDFECEECKYWYCKYRLEAVVYLQQLVSTTMTKETFQKVKCPVFLGYYYKDKENQDQVVRVDAMWKMFDQLGTPSDKKRQKAFPISGVHVIANSLFSKEIENVQKETFQFAEEIMQ